jgi:hypothetical protein
MTRTRRPRGHWPVMTYRRKQVLAYYEERVANGERVSIYRMARECGIYNYRTASRILSDLQALGHIPLLPTR